MKDRSDDPSHHERTLLPQSYISLPDLEGVGEEEICENIASQGVVVVKRINILRNNEVVPMKKTHIDILYANCGNNIYLTTII